MKKLYTLVALMLATTSIFAQLNESFEGAVFPPSGWTKANPDGGTGWRVDTVGTALEGWTGSGTIIAPTGGGNQVAAMTYVDGGATMNDSWLISPQFTLTAGNTISFHATNLTPSYADKLEVYVSTTTNQVSAFTTKIYENDNLGSTYSKIYLNLAAYVGQPIYIAFREYVADNFNDGGYVCLDLVATETAPTYPDLTIQNVFSPFSSASLTNAEQVKVLLKNIGYGPASGYTVTYQKGVSAPVSQVGTTPIAANDTMTFTFTTPVDLSTIGTDSIRIWVSISSDPNPDNDTIGYYEITHFQPTSLPMSMGFESTENLEGWILRNLNGSTSWSIGSTASLAHSGSRYALYGYNETLPGDDWLISNGISMTAGQNLNLSFYYRARNPQYPEKLNVYFMKGNAVNDTLIKLVDYPNISDTIYQHSVSSFTVPSTGIYYIGFHAYSDPDMWQLLIDDISVAVGASVNEVATDETFRTFPNPAREAVNIVSSSVIKSLAIYNALGQAVINMNPDTDNIQINTASLENGIYIIKAITANGQKTSKLVIK